MIITALPSMKTAWLPMTLPIKVTLSPGLAVVRRVAISTGSWGAVAKTRLSRGDEFSAGVVTETSSVFVQEISPAVIPMRVMNFSVFIVVLFGWFSVSGEILEEGGEGNESQVEGCQWSQVKRLCRVLQG